MPFLLPCGCDSLRLRSGSFLDAPLETEIRSIPTVPVRLSQVHLDNCHERVDSDQVRPRKIDLKAFVSTFRFLRDFQDTHARSLIARLAALACSCLRRAPAQPWSNRVILSTVSPTPTPRRLAHAATKSTFRYAKPRQKGSLLPRPGSAAFVEPTRVGPKGVMTPRYAGPVPPCPTSLDDKAPELTDEMVRVPTSELYSAALEAAWAELDQEDANSGRRPTPERVAQLEPNSKEYASPRPRHYGPYAIERAQLDWSYHVVPSRKRQALQDEIVSLVLEQRLRDCKDAGDDEPCRVVDKREGYHADEAKSRSGNVARMDDEHMGRQGDDRIGEKGRPLALFTAGCAGARIASSKNSR